MVKNRVITKKLVKKLIIGFPSLLDNLNEPYKRCAVAYYLAGKSVSDLEAIADHLLEGLTIVKRIRKVILNSAVILLYEKYLKEKTK